MTPVEPPVAPLDERKFEQESADRKRELDLREREVAAKERELDRPFWHNPTAIALFVGALGIFVNVGLAFLNNRSLQQIERVRSESNVILEAIRTGTGNTDAACKNLTFLVSLGFVKDQDGRIAKTCEQAPAGPPSLPAQTGGTQASPTLFASPWDVTGTVAEESGGAISGATVTATSLDITMPLGSPNARKVLATAQTDSADAFVLHGVSLGSLYMITVEKDGFEPYSQTVSSYALNPVAIRIVLKKK